MKHKFKVGDRVRFKTDKSIIPNSFTDCHIPNERHGAVGLRKNTICKVVLVKGNVIGVEWVSKDKELMRLGFKKEDLIFEEEGFFEPKCGICALLGKYCKRHR